MKISIKICGIAKKETVQVINMLDISYVGFVFFGKSKRYISLEEAADLSHILRDDIKVVALYVDPSDSELDALLQSKMRFNYIQLHGQEKPKRVLEIKQKMQCDIIKCFAIDENTNLSELDKNIAHYELGEKDKILFDAKPITDNDLPGGNGRVFDWRILDKYAMTEQFFLSGGLTPTNIHRALRVSKAQNVDVSSGVEVQNGHKDAALITQFVQAVENYTACSN